MKPAAFEYVAPDSLEQTLEALARHGDEAKLLAGGQSLVPMMSFRLAQPAVVVDLNRLGELDWLRRQDGGLSIGAMTRQRRLTEAPVADASPLLFETAPLIAHPQIRNRGTVGGSLAHADPAAELPVVAVALDARLKLRKAGGERWVAARDFFQGLLSTALEPDEMVVEAVFPAPPEGTGSAFLEIARRHGDYAQVGVAALVTLDREGICRRARLVYLSVGDVPRVAERAAAMMTGERPSAELFDAVAAHAASDEIDPSADVHASVEYKRHLARVLTRRALRRAVERAR